MTPEDRADRERRRREMDRERQEKVSVRVGEKSKRKFPINNVFCCLHTLRELSKLVPRGKKSVSNAVQTQKK